jgi:hypothetical protein
MKRRHFFFEIKLRAVDFENYNVKVRQFRPPLGLIIHCLFWLHAPVMYTSNEGERRISCMNCIMREHAREKQEARMENNNLV